MPRDEVVTNIKEISTVKGILGKDYTDKLQYSYPEAQPPYAPCGTKIVVQLRTPGNFKTLVNGQKFYFADESVEFEKYNIQTALVRAIGPVAFRDRRTMEVWPEGEWAVPGDFIRVPKFGGDRVGVPLNDEQKRMAMFLTIEDRDIIGLINGDPLGIVSIV